MNKSNRTYWFVCVPTEIFSPVGNNILCPNWMITERGKLIMINMNNEITTTQKLIVLIYVVLKKFKNRKFLTPSVVFIIYIPNSTLQSNSASNWKLKMSISMYSFEKMHISYYLISWLQSIAHSPQILHKEQPQTHTCTHKLHLSNLSCIMIVQVQYR